MLQKKKLTTSTTRFASIIRIGDYTKFFLQKNFKIKKNKKKNKKKFYNTVNPSVTLNSFTNYSNVVVKPLFSKKPYKLFFFVKSIYNNILTIPGIDLLLSGSKTFNLTKDFFFKKINYLGSQIFLGDLPYTLHVSCISNNYNNKWTYSLSGGTFITKLKAKKTVKLIFVELPSLKRYLFFKKTKCFIGKNTNFFSNKFIEGKWGFSIHKFKKICVRGVAMNPVDHPNGGRTKAKQPEKSPWGWIAKHNK